MIGHLLTDRVADWYDTEYLNLYIDDPSGVAEKIMELMDVKVPAKSGRYRVKRICSPYL